MPTVHARDRRTGVAVTALLAIALGGCGETLTPMDPDGDVDPTSVTVTAPSDEVEQGATLQLAATVAPFGAPQDVTWSTGDAAIALVDGAGLVTPVATGDVTITATSTADATLSGSIEITVTCRNLTQAIVADGGTISGDHCYQALSPLSVNDGTLVVEAGAHISFGPNGSLNIASGGRLTAVGTADEPITFTSLDPVQLWRGIRFNGSASLDNRLEHVTLENGASGGWNGATYATAALYLEGSSRLDVAASTISGSGGIGISATQDVELTVTGTTFAGNAIPAWVHPEVAHAFASDNVFDGNDEQAVRVAFGNTDALRTDATWAALGVPYDVQTRMFVEASLTILPGATLRFEADVSMIVRNDGVLNAIGTAEDPIGFTGVEALPGYWKGIQIATASASNILDRVFVEYGGGSAWTGDSDSRAMIDLEGNSRLLITRSTLRYSDHYALWVPAGGNISGFEDNVVERNGRTMVVHPNRVGEIGGGNSFVDNDEQLVRVSFGNTDALEDEQTWLGQDVPYLVTVRTFVEGPLTIEAGAVVYFAQDASLIVREDGSLAAEGTADQPVVFSGAEALSGYWKGLEFGTVSANNLLSNVVLEYAGSEGWFGGSDSVATLYVTGDGFLDLEDVLIRDTGGYALILGNGGAVTCSNVDDSGFMYYDQATSSATTICP